MHPLNILERNLSRPFPLSDRTARPLEPLMMHLVQILLPIHDNSQEPFPREEYSRVQKELYDRFGGLTVYTRAPAEGHWKVNDNHTSLDDIVVFEVMASELDPKWWGEYRRELETRFRQNVVLVRAQQTQLL